MGAGNSAAEEATRSRGRAAELRQQALRLEQRADAFAAGDIGERAVAEQLERLTHLGYRRFDDVLWPGRVRANIDVCLIGPAGLFVIDAKNWSGSVQVKDGGLRQNGYRRDKDTDGAAEATRGLIAAMALPPIGHAVICLAGSAALPRPSQVNGVTVISLSQLVEWIAAQPNLVSPIAAAEMADRLSLLLRPATRPQSPPYQRRAAARQPQPARVRATTQRPARGAKITPRPSAKRRVLASLASFTLVIAASEIYVHVMSQALQRK